MNPKRRQRLYAVGFLLMGTAVAVGLSLFALRENINLFYPPAEIAAGKAPIGPVIRAGGMVQDGSVQRATDSLKVRFVIDDRAGSEVAVIYEGILPDLFREGQGIVATGRLNEDGTFEASEVLAKHDENYMPPELMDMAEAADMNNEAQL